jgi:hypothetical protein
MEKKLRILNPRDFYFKHCCTLLFLILIDRTNTMTAYRVLILGGHGKVSLLLTKLLVKEPGWHISSVIRNPSQKDEILELGRGQSGEIDVLIESLDDVRSVEQAKEVLKKADPKYVIWSAGKHSTSLRTPISDCFNDKSGRRWRKRRRIENICH